VKRPQLQGFAPREDPTLSSDGLGRNRAAALLSFRPSRVFSLTSKAWTFIQDAPPVVALPDAETASEGPLQGFACRRDGLASREAADPPGV
jgi:hypothetical protein